MQENFPFWAERKMCFFVPALTPIDEKLFGL